MSEHGVNTPSPRIGISGERFVVNGTPAFLLGISYFDGFHWRRRDLEMLAERGFNAVRIWLDFKWKERPKTFFDDAGEIPPTNSAKLLDLVSFAGSLGMIVDVTILGWTSSAHGHEWSANLNAVRSAVRLLKGQPNVFYDVANEHNNGINDHAYVAELIRAGREQDASAILFSSNWDDPHFHQKDETLNPAEIDGEIDAGMSLLAPHLRRSPDWAARTAERTKRVSDYLHSKSVTLPIYLQEDARRGFFGHFPERDEFLTAARLAKEAGAAGWVFHNEAGFDLSEKGIFERFDPVEREVVDRLGSAIQRAQK